MALESISFALQFVSKGNDALSDTDIRQELALTPDYPVEVFGRTRNNNTVVTVTFPAALLDTQSSDDDTPDRLAEDVARLQGEMVEWISGHAQRLASLAARGVVMRLIGNLWINADQFDLVLSPALAKCCGLNGVEIYLLSNE